jgi:hypothetical protein
LKPRLGGDEGRGESMEKKFRIIVIHPDGKRIRLDIAPMNHDDAMKIIRTMHPSAGKTLTIEEVA